MTTIARTPVTSSLIKAMGHDAAENILAVEFHSGPVYHYANFTEKDWADLRAAPSVGSHFSRFVKPSYVATRVDAVPATFSDMVEAIKVSATEVQAELALKAIMSSPDYTPTEKAEATEIFNKRHAIVLEG